MNFYKKKEDAGLLDRRETLKEKINRLNKNIKLCKEYKEEAIKQVRQLEGQYKKRIFSYTEYEYLLNQYLKGQSLDYWVSHYESQEKNLKEKLNSLKLQKHQYLLERERIISEKRSTNLNYKKLAYSFIAVMLALGLAFSCYQVFKPSSDNLITGFGVIEQNKDMFITNYTPDSDVTVKAGESQIFTITTQPLENLSIQWYVNNMAVEGQNAETFNYIAETPGEYEVKVLVNDMQNYSTIKWDVKVEENITLPEESITLPEEGITVPSENITLPEENVTIPPPENVTEPDEAEENATEITKPEENLTTQIINLEQLPAEINKPVQWIIRAKKLSGEYLEVEIPAQASAISVDRIIRTPTLEIGEIQEPVLKDSITIKRGASSMSLSDYGLAGQSATGFFVTNIQSKGLLSTVTDWMSFQFLIYKTYFYIRKASSSVFSISLKHGPTAFATAEEEKTTLVVTDEAEEFEISYQTPAPQIIEKEEPDKKTVTVYSDMNYTNILTYTKINEGKTVLGVSWLVNDSSVNMTYQLYDDNSNGITDKVSWITPHLSEQTFEVLLSDELSYTGHLADVYIPTDEIYYITNCPNEYCGPPNDPNVAKLEENPDDFYAVTNLQTKVIANDFGAQMKFDIRNKPENFTWAFICSYAKEKMLIEPLTNYVEVLDDANKPLSLNGVELGWASGSMDQIPGWNCIDITEQLKQKSDTQLTIRWWGQDSEEKNGTAQFARFLALSPLEKCEGYNPSNASDCRPYLGIKL